MQRLLVIVLIGSIALAEVSARPEWRLWKKKKPEPVTEPPVEKPPKEVDFEALNGYLVDNVPETDELEANLNHIKAEMNKLKPGVDKAGQMLLALVKRPEDKCSDELMTVLLELRRTELKLHGQKRIEKLLRDSWNKVLSLCTKHIESFYKDSPPSKVKFFRLFNTYLLETGPIRRIYGDCSNKRLYLILKQLIKDQPDLEFEVNKYCERTGNIISRKDRVKFGHAFEELFVKTCKDIKSNVGVMVNMGAIALADSLEHKARGGGYLPVDLRLQEINMNWTRDVCTKLINMDESERTNVFNAVYL